MSGNDSYRDSHTFDDAPDNVEVIHLGGTTPSSPPPDPAGQCKPRVYMHKNLGQTQTVVTVILELPGFDEGEVDLRVYDNFLQISGKSKLFDSYDKEGGFIDQHPPATLPARIELATGLWRYYSKHGMRCGFLLVEFHLKRDPRGITTS